MKLKHKILAYSMVPALLGAGLLGINSVSANGWFGGFGGNLTADQIVTRQQTMFQNEAQLLGISLDKVKDAWESYLTQDEPKGRTGFSFKMSLKP